MGRVDRKELAWSKGGGNDGEELTRHNGKEG